MARVPQYSNPGIPSNLYTGGAVRIDTRPLANMLFQEQRFQEAKRQQQSQALDEEMKSNVSKIRDADVPDYISAYQKYAGLTKQSLFNDKLKRDPQAYAQLQIERGKAYANAQQLANQSKSLRENFDALNKDYYVNGDKYVDDFGAKMSYANKLPISKLQGVDLGHRDEKGNPVLMDLTNPDTYLDQHNYYDFGTALNKAYGPTKYTGYSTQTPLDKKGIDFLQTDYKAGNHPLAVANNLLTDFSGSKQALKAARQFGSQITDDMWNNVVKDYNNTTVEKLKQMGLDKLEDLSTLHFPGNLAEKTAHFLAMQHFNNAKVETDAPKRIVNEANKMAYEQAFQREQTNTKFQNDLKVKAAKEGGQVSGNDIVDTLYKDALTNEPKPFYPKSGGQVLLYPAKVDAQLKEALAFKNSDGHIMYPDEVKFSADGKYIYPLVYERGKDKNGKEIIIKNKDTNKTSVKTGEPVLTDVLRARMGKTLFGVKGATTIMNGQPKPPNPSTNYTIKGQKYTHKQLNDMGYNDDQIQEAIKAGNIK